MKLKIGYKWKSIDGPCKGEEFVITKIEESKVYYEKVKDGIHVYEYDRKAFEKYIERVIQHWNERNKSYKHKKQQLRND